MRKIDAKATHLADEFRANPLGPFGPELQHVVNIFRNEPLAGRHILIHDRQRQTYVLGELTGVPGEPVIRHEDPVFESPEEAEWHVFKLRWKKHTGHDLPG